MRYIVFSGLAYLLLVTMGALHQVFGITEAVPDVALALVLYVVFSRRGNAPSHAIFALVLGYLVDVLGGSPRGLHAFGLITLALLARLFSHRLELKGVLAQAAAVALACIVYSSLLAFVRAALGPDPAAGTWFPSLPHLVATTLCGPVIFKVGENCDGKLGLTSSAAPLRALRLRAH